MFEPYKRLAAGIVIQAFRDLGGPDVLAQVDSFIWLNWGDARELLSELDLDLSPETILLFCGRPVKHAKKIHGFTEPSGEGDGKNVRTTAEGIQNAIGTRSARCNSGRGTEGTGKETGRTGKSGAE